MWINFSVSENDMERIREDIRSGQLKLPEGGRFAVEVEMVDGSLFPYTGKITFADPSYNSTTGTFLLRATVNNPEGALRPNQYVRARLTGAIRPNAIVVPQRSVQQSGKGHFVWVINKDNQAELRPVTVGDWIAEDWLIAEGLAEGDQVVVDGGIRLTQGASVKTSSYVPAASSSVSAKKGNGRSAQVSTGTSPSSVSVYFPSGQATLNTDAQRALRIAAAAYIGIGTQILIVSELLIETLDLHSTERVLDVATGSGNAALAAARRGCQVVGVDYVPALLDRARRRAETEGLGLGCHRRSSQHHRWRQRRSGAPG